MGVLQIGEIFAKPLLHLSWQKLQAQVVLSGENEIVKRSNFSPGAPYHNLPCMETLFEMRASLSCGKVSFKQINAL